MNGAAGLESIGTDTRGATYVEYLLLLGLVALIAIPAFRRFGGAATTTLRAQGVLVDGLLPLMGF